MFLYLHLWTFAQILWLFVVLLDSYYSNLFNCVSICLNMLNFVWLCLTHAVMHKFCACYLKKHNKNNTNNNKTNNNIKKRTMRITTTAKVFKWLGFNLIVISLVLFQNGSAFQNFRSYAQILCLLFNVQVWYNSLSLLNWIAQNRKNTIRVVKHAETCISCKDLRVYRK